MIGYHDWPLHNRLCTLERKVISLESVFRQLGFEANALRTMQAVGVQPMVLQDGVAGGTQPPTTAPPTTAGTTVAPTTAAATTAAGTSATTAPATTYPNTGPHTTQPPGTTVAVTGCNQPPDTVTVTSTGGPGDCNGTFVCTWTGNASLCSWSGSDGGITCSVIWTGWAWNVAFTGSCTDGCNASAADCHTSGTCYMTDGELVTVTP